MTSLPDNNEFDANLEIEKKIKKDVKALAQILETVFSYEALLRMIRYDLRINPDLIVAGPVGLADFVFRLIIHFERSGKLVNLLEGVIINRPDNQAVQEFCRNLGVDIEKVAKRKPKDDGDQQSKPTENKGPQFNIGGNVGGHVTGGDLNIGEIQQSAENIYINTSSTQKVVSMTLLVKPPSGVKLAELSKATDQLGLDLHRLALHEVRVINSVGILILLRPSREIVAQLIKFLNQWLAQNRNYNLQLSLPDGKAVYLESQVDTAAEQLSEMVDSILISFG